MWPSPRQRKASDVTGAKCSHVYMQLHIRVATCTCATCACGHVYAQCTYVQLLCSLCLCLSLTIKHTSFLGLKSCPYMEVMVPMVVS